MKICKILLVSLFTLFVVTGCNSLNGGKTTAVNASGAEGSSSSVSGSAANAGEKSSAPEESGAVFDPKSSVPVEYYGTNTNASAYKINGNFYMNLNDLSNLLRTKFTYNKADDTVLLGDAARANAAYYMPDLSAYPNLDRVIELPPYEVWTDGGVVDFKFLTKGVAFRDMMPKIDKALKADGFTAAEKEQYAELTKAKDEFQKGERKNTYVKYKDANKEVTPYAIQIIDGGVDKNKIPIIIVQMTGC